MSEKSKYPDSQPFNIGGRKNLTKNLKGKVSWWAKPPYHNNAVNRSTNSN